MLPGVPPCPASPASPASTRVLVYQGDDLPPTEWLAELRRVGVRLVVATPCAGGRPDAVLLHDLGRGGEAEALCRRIATYRSVIVRVPVRLSALQQEELIRLANERAGLRVHCDTARWGMESAATLAALLDAADGGPLPLVCRRLLPLVGVDASAHLLVAATCGPTRCSSLDYAGRLGRSLRAVQAAHARLALPSPHRLLLWGQALWALWRMEHLGMSVKQAALRGGFVDASAMSAALRPVLAATPRVAARSGGVDGLIERWRARLIASTASRGTIDVSTAA